MTSRWRSSIDVISLPSAIKRNTPPLIEIRLPPPPPVPPVRLFANADNSPLRANAGV